MAPQGSKRRQGAIDAAGSQLGDINADHIIGGDMHIGANADDMLAFIKQYIWNDVQESDIERDRLRQELSNARLEIWLWRILVIGGVLYELLRGL